MHVFLERKWLLKVIIPYSRVRNKPLCFFNFWNFFQGLQYYYGLKRHKFAHFKGLCLFISSNVPETMFFQKATSIPDSRVYSSDFVISETDKIKFRDWLSLVFYHSAVHVLLSRFDHDLIQFFRNSLHSGLILVLSN